MAGAEPADRAREGGGGLSDPAELWSGATYECIAETLAPIHERLVAALDPRRGERVLDLACGTGGVALRAARTGADVVGLDISPDQLEKARAAAAAARLPIRFDEGDCHALPYESAGFDVVASAFGMIFATSHAKTAAELARVCRPSARIALTAWPEDGWSRLGEQAGREYPPGDDPRLWADEDHARALLGDFELRFEHGEWVVAADSPRELWDFLASSVPPLKAWLDGLTESRRAEVDRLYLDFLAAGELRRPYVVVLGRRR